MPDNYHREISVVIPLYNKEKYVQRTIESVLNQTFQNFECIVIDSSDDGSSNLVRQYSDSRIIHIKREKTTAAAARNLGVRIAKTDFIAFLDADDEWMPDHLETLVSLKKNYPDAGLFSTSYVKLKTDGRPMVMLFIGIPNPPWEGYLSRYLQICSHGDEPVNSSSCAVPKDIFLNMGGFPEYLMYGEDQFLWGKISLTYPVAYSWNGLTLYHTDALGRICDEPHAIGSHPFSEYLKQELAAGNILPGKQAECRAYIRKKRYTEIFQSFLMQGPQKSGDEISEKQNLVGKQPSTVTILSRLQKKMSDLCLGVYNSSFHDLIRRVLCTLYGSFHPSLDLSAMRGKLPRISIITPSYQQGEFIESTLNSVITQEYPSLEYIVIDGGSTDNTVEIIRRHESKITFWASEPDRGQADALNKGFKLATGEIIGWINSDDMLLPDALRAVGTFFSIHPDINLVYGDALALDRQGTPLFLRKPSVFDIRWLIRTDDIPQSSVFFRRDFLMSIGYLDDRLHYALDYDLLIKAALKQDPVYLPATLSAFRIYPETKTAAGKTQFSVDIVYLIDRILRQANISDERKRYLLTTQFWRIFEIILADECGKVELNRLNNNPDVIQIALRYRDVLYPHYLWMMNISVLLDNRGLQEILAAAMADLLNQYPDGLNLSDTAMVKRPVRDQALDIVIFTTRLWHVHKRREALKLISNIVLFIPSVFLDPHFWKIVQSMMSAQLKKTGS